MDFLRQLLDLFLHVDRHLLELIASLGGWIYALLFAIVFCETGLVVTPFLPGDSLLFAVGAFAATGSLDLTLCVVVLTAAAVLGDTVNYWIGYALGPRLAREGKLRFVKKEHLDKTHAFYEKYGAKTIILARFVPIVRTFAPFVAGIGSMTYKRFMSYNVIGGVAWVLLCTLSGYFFGNLPFVKQHFELVLLGIIFISILPGVIEFLRARRARPSPSS
jgi:membrane-associated protein